MTEKGIYNRLMERNRKAQGKVIARRFFAACGRIDRKTKGKLRETTRRKVGRSYILFGAVRKPRPSLIHKGGKP